MNYDTVTQRASHLSGPNVIQDLKYCGRASYECQGNAKPGMHRNEKSRPKQKKKLTLGRRSNTEQSISYAFCQFFHDCIN